MWSRWRERRAQSASTSASSAKGVFDKPIVVSRLVFRYFITGLLALVIVAVVTAWVSRSLGTSAAIEDAGKRITSAVCGCCGKENVPVRLDRFFPYYRYSRSSHIS